MNEMITKIARALSNSPAPDFDYMARAALYAILEPSDRMMAAGCAAHPGVPYNAATTLDDIIRAGWTAMVEAALEC